MKYAHALVAHTGEALVALDPETRVLSWNRGATFVFGWTAEEALGKDIGSLVLAPDNDRALRALVGEAGATGSAAFEGAARTKSGEEIHIEAVVRHVEASDGEPAWIAFFARDTTERTLLLREVFDQNLRLEKTLVGLREAEQSLTRSERFALAGQLAASVCHNLRNPLGAIKNGLFYVQRRIGATADPKVAEQLRIMEQEVAASARLVADLLERVREPAIERAPTSVRELVDAAIARVVGLDRVGIVNDVPASLEDASIDASLMSRCVTNLVQNAVEAFDGAGGVEPLPSGTVTVSAWRDGDGLALDIVDDGCGIDADVLPRVTAPLFTTKPGRPGAGLSIAENIVGRHGGELVVRAREGGGTQVSLFLPKAYGA